MNLDATSFDPRLRSRVRLFVVGDSISMQYGPALERALPPGWSYDRKRDGGGEKGAANLDVPQGANAGDSRMVLGYLRHRRRHARIAADVLLVNCGLHDIKTAGPAAPRQVPLDEYEKNLRAIVTEARAMHLRVVWASTTPVDDAIHAAKMHEFMRFASDVAAYNAAADRIMAELQVPVIDLHGFSRTLVPTGLVDHVHYDEPSQIRQAGFLAERLAALAAKGL